MPSVEVRPLHVGDAVVGGKTYPFHAYALVHPDGLVLVDTGMIDSVPELDEAYSPTLHPLTEHDVPIADVKVVINTHLHFDHWRQPPLSRDADLRPEGRAGGGSQS